MSYIYIMSDIKIIQLEEDIKNTRKNIESAKDVIENAKKYLHQEEQLLIIHLNKLEVLKKS